MRENEYVEGLEHFLAFSREDTVDIDSILKQLPNYAGSTLEDLKSKGSGPAAAQPHDDANDTHLYYGLFYIFYDLFVSAKSLREDKSGCSQKAYPAISWLTARPRSGRRISSTDKSADLGSAASGLLIFLTFTLSIPQPTITSV